MLYQFRFVIAAAVLFLGIGVLAPAVNTMVAGSNVPVISDVAQFAQANDGANAFSMDEEGSEASWWHWNEIWGWVRYRLKI